jgi:2'-5' RNA ligase
LTALHAALVAALRQHEVTFEARDYAPHVTLGRVGGRVSPDAVARLRRTDAYCMPHRDFGAWTADAIHVIRSELRPDGARYTTLYTSALRG